MSTFITELRRRSVVKVSIAYAVIAWVLIQIVVSIEEPLHLPQWADTLIIVILAVGFPVVVFLAWTFDLTPGGIRRTWPEATENARIAAPTSDKPSIAVLPFADMSSDRDQEYFGDGMTEELLNSLARIKELRVAGRTSSFFYKGRNEDLRTIGQALGVRYLLEGSVRKSGDRLRITSQLIDAATDAHLWSESYDRTLDDLFQIQEDIAKSVVAALQITLGVGELAKVPGMTRNPEAYEEFLKANVKEGVDIVVPPSADLYRKAIMHLERAVAIDPDYSLAWVGLQYLYENSAGISPDGLPDGTRKADRARAKSLALTPDSPFVLSNLAMSQVTQSNWHEAERFHLRSREAARKHAVEDHFSFRAAQFYHLIGKLDQAIDLYERGRIADPLNAYTAAYLSDCYLSIGEPGKAFNEVDRFAQIDDSSVVMVRASGLMAAMVTGDRKELERRLDDVIRAEPYKFLSEIMRDRLDDREAAVRALHEKLTDPNGLSPFLKNIVAIWATYWGEHELALELLTEFLTRTQATRNLLFLVWREVYRECRKLPAFKVLLIESGLVDYWRESGNWSMFCRPVGDDDFEVV